MADSNMEPAAFRKALGSFATGVTIVTTKSGDELFGVTANSFNSVSLDPPLILWSLAKSSASLAAFSSAPSFAVHILGSDQQPLSDRFARRGVDKFAEVPVAAGIDGVPLLPGCAACFECRTTYRYEGGDHFIFVGEVVNFTHGEKEPLLFHAGRYALAARGVEEEERVALEQDPRSDDLTYLVASSYFQLLSPVRRRAAAAGLSLSDHYALNVLLAQGASRLEAINEAIGHVGLETDRAAMTSLALRDLVTVEDEASSAIIALTEAGRVLLIELIAAAKAREADAQSIVDEADIRMLKRLLRRFVKRLEGSDTAAGVSRHMDLMRAAARADVSQTLTTLGK